ncbi:MAG: ATP synthase F1 subunit gamma [Proteobacteria bacterium]|nr:ATP synthase F1 subunit gamma [Pseudomonadota bacterium]
MANLKDIKRRIGSVKSTQKITNAMKLVSAAKFARASHAVDAARPYAKAFDRMVERLLLGQSDLQSPLLRQHDEKRSLILILATDRGLCGGLNSNLFKTVNLFLQEKAKAGVKMEVYAGGRRAIAFAKKSGLKIIAQEEKVLEAVKVSRAKRLVQELEQRFTSEEYDRVYIAFPFYKSALDQIPTIEQLLPVRVKRSADGEVGRGYAIVEPDLELMLDKLLERKLVTYTLAALLSGTASEQGARMTAMDSATNNAKEVTRKLTLQYNRARQAAITKELIEIISGSEALN